MLAFCVRALSSQPLSHQKGLGIDMEFTGAVKGGCRCSLGICARGGFVPVS